MEERELPSQESTGALVRDALDEVRTLFKTEVALAKDEVRSEIAGAKTSVMAFAGAAAAAFLGVAMLLVAFATAMFPRWVPSLLVGLASSLLGSGLGGVIGLLSAYAGGKTDLIVQRILDILQGLPLLVLALVMSTALGPSIQNVVLAISIPIVPRAARVVRSSVLSIREMQYVEAAGAVGVGHLRIAFRHILPNTMGPFIVLCTAQLGSAILVEATLSFLGLGVPEPYPSWGRMLSVSAAEYAQKAPHLVLFPGIAISLAVFGSNLLGDALRDTLDPRLRGS